MSGFFGAFDQAIANSYLRASRPYDPMAKPEEAVAEAKFHLRRDGPYLLLAAAVAFTGYEVVRLL